MHKLRRRGGRRCRRIRAVIGVLRGRGDKVRLAGIFGNAPAAAKSGRSRLLRAADDTLNAAFCPHDIERLHRKAVFRPFLDGVVRVQLVERAKHIFAGIAHAQSIHRRRLRTGRHSRCADRRTLVLDCDIALRIGDCSVLEIEIHVYRRRRRRIGGILIQDCQRIGICGLHLLAVQSGSINLRVHHCHIRRRKLRRERRGDSSLSYIIRAETEFVESLVSAGIKAAFNRGRACQNAVDVDQIQLAYIIIDRNDMHKLRRRRSTRRIGTLVILVIAIAGDKIRCTGPILGKAPAAVFRSAYDTLNASLHAHDIESLDGKAVLRPRFDGVARVQLVERAKHIFAGIAHAQSVHRRRLRAGRHSRRADRRTLVLDRDIALRVGNRSILEIKVHIRFGKLRILRIVAGRFEFLGKRVAFSSP